MKTPAGWLAANYEKVRGATVDDALAMIRREFPDVTKDELGALWLAEDARRHAVDIRDVEMGRAVPGRSQGIEREDQPTISELKREGTIPRFCDRIKRATG